MIDADYLFLNFLLKPQSPIRPEPNRSMVAGSGTGAALITRLSKPIPGVVLQLPSAESAKTILVKLLKLELKIKGA